MPIMSREDFDRLWNTFTPAQLPEELWWLCQKLNELQPTKCLEIGGGASSIFWGFFAPTISLTLGQYSDSDIPHTPKDFSGFEKLSPYLEEYGATTYVCDSHKQATLDAVALHGPYDFLFIDGDHRRTGVEQDIAMYFPLVVPGGLIAFHDWDHFGSYPPDPILAPIQEACRNLGIVPDEIKIEVPLWYGIAIVRKT